jgi:hypothetical protein
MCIKYEYTLEVIHLKDEVFGEQSYECSSEALADERSVMYANRAHTHLNLTYKSIPTAAKRLR